MKFRFKIGDRVRVSSNRRFAGGATGTVEAGDGWPEGRKVVPRPEGVIIMYWVAFDESQRGLESEGDDDSLYGVDEIEEESLNLI